MIGKLVSSVIGAKIDRKDGDSGAKGAVLGYLAPGVVKATAKIGALAALGWGVVTLAKRVKK